MADPVRCPDCLAEQEILPGQAGQEIVCPWCDARFRPGQSTPRTTWTQRRRTESRRTKPRRTKRDEVRRAASQILGTPAKLLQVAAAVQLAAPLGILALVLMDWANGKGPGPNAPLPAAGWVAIAVFLILKDVVVLVGASRMLKFRSYRVSLAGAIAALWPVDWCAWFSVLVGIWAIIALNNPTVRRAFSEREAPPEDEWEREPPAPPPPAVRTPPAAQDDDGIIIAEVIDTPPAGRSVGEWDADEAEAPVPVTPKRDRQRRTIKRAEAAVYGPAVVLLILWSLGGLFALGVVVVTLFAFFGPPAGNPPPDDDEILLAVMGLVYTIIVAVGVYGTFQMLRLRSYGWGMASAILMMLSFCGCLPALGVGIWAIIVFNQSDVSRGFSLNRSQNRQSGTDDD